MVIKYLAMGTFSAAAVRTKEIYSESKTAPVGPNDVTICMFAVIANIDEIQGALQVPENMESYLTSEEQSALISQEQAISDGFILN